MARTQELFSIGDVAQLFHLSVSSLRHYETIGLLTPEYTDPATGYRYYGPRQFEVLNTIRYLRAHALAPADFSREITMIDYGLTSDPEKIVTEIRIPVRATE